MERALEILLSGAAGALLVWILQVFTERRRRRYERRLYIFRTLLANSVNVVSLDFVSAFNMILIEYGSKTKVREWHNEFIKHVNLPAVKTKTEIDARTKMFNTILVKLIEELAKSIHIKIEQLDISNKIYWPKGFNDASEKQHKLTDLLIENQGIWNNLLGADKVEKKLIFEVAQNKKKVTKKDQRKKK